MQIHMKMINEWEELSCARKWKRERDRDVGGEKSSIMIFIFPSW